MKIKTLLVLLTIMTVLFAGCSAQEAQKPETDAVASASMVTDEASLVKAMSNEGAWIIVFTGDMTTDKELVLEGEFHDKGDASKDLYRKLAPYAQDEEHNVTARYTLTAPKLTIKSPNTRIQGGTFKGDVYVEAEGFNLKDATVDGNIYFANEELKSAFALADDAAVTGKTEVKQ